MPEMLSELHNMKVMVAKGLTSVFARFLWRALSFSKDLKLSRSSFNTF